MNMKPLIGLMLASVLGIALADEPYDQLKSQIQKVEKRADGLEKSIKQAQDSTSELKKQFGELAASGKLQQQKLSELNVKLNALEGRQTTLGGSLDQLSRDTEQKTQTIDETIMSRSKWYGAAIAALLLLLGGCYWYLRRRNDASEQSLTAQVKSAMETVRSTEEKIAKSDTALADSLFEILNKLKVQEMSASANGQSKPAEVDHNLPLKLADEIHRMRKRLASLPEDTKGLTPLQKSLERLESELSEQGYEIVDHTGMTYTENLSVKARFVPSDDLGPDQKIISKVVTPQVNYKGVMIRMADIEVSIGS
jgi:chromosome segregation ATPase